jgi:excisionase family DNA binding protein
MAKEAFGTYEIAKLCRVAPSTVGRWIDENKLPSFKTLGGRRRVWKQDLIAMMRKMGLRLPDGWSGDADRILIVDDEPFMRDVLKRELLSVLPTASIHEAVNGFEAGQKAATVRPALLLLDINLPGANGLDVCRSLRQDPSYENIRIVAMTGASAGEMRDAVLAAGADEFLQKPFDAPTLLEMLRRLLPNFAWVSVEGARAQPQP